MNSFITSEDTRNTLKTTYNQTNTRNMANLRNNLSKVNVNLNDNYSNNPNITDIDLEKMKDNYKKLNTDRINNMFNSNFKYPQPSENIVKEDPLLDKGLNELLNQRKIENINNSEPHKELNNIINFENNSIHIPENLSVNDSDLENYYLAEIGDKRKFSNLLLQSISKTFKNFKMTESIEILINNLLEKFDINDKVQLKFFSQELKKIISEKPNITNKINMDKKISPYNITSESLYEKDTKDIEYIITINSGNRNKQIWKHSNDFTIFFGPDSNIHFQDILDQEKDKMNKEDIINLTNTNSVDSSNDKGYINRSFNNIKSIELLEVILPNYNTNYSATINHKLSSDEIAQPDNYDNFPYIILEFEEIGGLYEGTSNELCNAFALLSYCEKQGNFRYYRFNQNNRIIKYYNPRIGLNKLNIKIKKPYPIKFPDYSEEVKLFDFGILKKDDDYGHISYEIPNISLTFKITCIHKSLDSMYINPK